MEKAGEMMQSLSDRLMVSIDFVKCLSYSCFFNFILYFVFFPSPRALGKVLINFIKTLVVVILVSLSCNV